MSRRNRVRMKDLAPHTPRQFTEGETLLHNPDAREELKPDEKVLARAKKKDDELKNAYGKKLTTREDVVNLIAVYNNNNILPLALQLDEIQALLALPPWVRWWRWFKGAFLNWRQRWTTSPSSSPE